MFGSTEICWRYKEGKKQFKRLQIALISSKARDAEAKVLKLGKQLEEAQNYVQQLNKKQYEG